MDIVGPIMSRNRRPEGSQTRRASAWSVALLLMGPFCTEGTAQQLSFVDVSQQAGIDFRHRHGGQGNKYLPETMGGGGCLLDYDGDGWLDVYLVQSGSHDSKVRSGNALYHNRKDGTFSQVPESAGADDRGYGMGCAVADYDNDGRLDIYVTNFGPNALLRNRGDGTFENMALPAGVADPRWSVSAAFADVEGDGDLDLYVANYLTFDYQSHVKCGDENSPSYCHPDVYPAASNQLYLNDGHGRFRPASPDSGPSPRDPSASKSLGTVFFDMDDDGDPDLYVANDSTANYLFRNDGAVRFEDISALSGTAFNLHGKTEAGMGIAAGDLNGDGLFDLVVTHLDFETNTVYLNDGRGFFTDQTDRSGLGGPSKSRVGFGVNAADFDNDGDLDLFVANGHVIDNIAAENPSLTHAQPNQLFLNQGGVFSDVSSQAGEPFGRSRVSRGSVAGDIDNDGHVDLLVINNNGPAELLLNQGSGTSWIGLELHGRHCNRFGIGARIELEAEGLRLIRELRAGGGYAGYGHPRLHLGLGRSLRIKRVTIRWPCGRKQVLETLRLGRYQVVEEPGDE